MTGSKEFADVPLGHWAYPALQKLAAAGIVEGYPPTGNFIGQRPMTRYEFAVAIARILDRIPGGGTTTNTTVENPYNDKELRDRIAALEAKPGPDITKAQVQDLIDSLRREFNDELARLGGQVKGLDDRLAIVEAKIAAPPRMTIAASFLHRRGYANYIDNANQGRRFLRPDLAPGTVGINSTANGVGGGNPFISNNSGPGGDPFDVRVNNRTFSYTDFEVRLTDRVSDRLSVNAALRSLGSNYEDPWAGDTNGGVYVREANITANLNNFRFLGLRNASATFGRQRTKIGQGLIYDNDLSPTDQLRYDANLGPFSLMAFFGSQTNVGIGSGFGGGNGNDPYGNTGANFFLNPGSTGNLATDVANQRLIGFSNTGASPADDTESGLRAATNLFRISGQPVQLGYTRLLDGYRRQGAESVDLTLPLFNRTIGIEVVRSLRTADGTDTSGLSRPIAGIATANILRTKILDLNASYGQADDNFEFLAASSANPYARSYGEALFDRPIFLGAPMINGTGIAGIPAFLTAKRGFDISGTVRLPISFLRRVPLDFRYYKADSGRFVAPVGSGLGVDNDGLSRVKLGEVYTVGTTFNLTPGADLEVKGGWYNPTGVASTVRYVRVGVNVGF
ncbi:S-layer homology domain-containing protein [bacterium]|nr:MAG: S-layer homology domain-containing protein [bacterium]